MRCDMPSTSVTSICPLGGGKGVLRVGQARLARPCRNPLSACLFRTPFFTTLFATGRLQQGFSITARPIFHGNEAGWQPRRNHTHLPHFSKVRRVIHRYSALEIRVGQICFTLPPYTNHPVASPLHAYCNSVSKFHTFIVMLFLKSPTHTLSIALSSSHQ